MSGRDAGEKSPAYRVFVNGGFWGVFYAPSARAACDNAKAKWVAMTLDRRVPIRDVEAFEVVD